MEEFLELSNRGSWHDASLGACFHLGLDVKTIHCELPTSNYSLIELINLVLFLNGSDREVEVVLESRHPAPAGTRSMAKAHPRPRTSAYLFNGSACLSYSEDSPSSPLVPSSSPSSPLVLHSSPSSPLVPPSSALPERQRLPSALQCLLQDSASQCLLQDSTLQCLLLESALQGLLLASALWCRLLR